MEDDVNKKSIDPNNPDYSGLLHFYQVEHPDKEIEGKKVKQWKLLTQEQYEQNKATLPNICFATRHNIIGLAERLKKIKTGAATDEDWLHDSDLPDLDSLMSEVIGDDNAAMLQAHQQKKTSDGAAISSDSPLYYSFQTIDGITSKVFASESEAL